MMIGEREQVVTKQSTQTYETRKKKIPLSNGTCRSYFLFFFFVVAFAQN